MGNRHKLYFAGTFHTCNMNLAKKNKDVFKNYGFIGHINLYYLNSGHVELVRGERLKIAN